MQDGHSTDKAGNVGSAPQHPSVSVPQVMLKEGNTLLNAGKYDEGIELLEDALRAAIVQAGNELDYSLAKYYYAYGDGIIAKLSTSTEIFGEAIQEAITRKEGEISQEIKKEEATAPKSQPDEDEKKAPEAEAEAEASGDDVDDGSDKDVKITVVEPEEKKGLAVPIPPPADPGKKPQENEEPTEDVQIAWENMETARVIAEKRRSDLAATARDSDEYKEAARLAAKVYMSIGEILSMQEREDDALLEFSKALALRLEVEGKESRGLAETYFTIGTAILRKKGKERQAIENFHSAAKILEANLCRALGTPFDDREERKVSDYQISSSPLVKPQPGDSGEVKELREVLSGVYMKV
ncbi:MAG: tetratricopeptide repeat protein [Candidatus Pacebacteria bacterium]|nr:tetratricopeptide repeat protein [Candidatus Paceibacterota bacterium]